MCLQNLCVDIVDELGLFSSLLSEEPQGLPRTQIKGEVEGVDDDPWEDLHTMISTLMVMLAASASR